MKLFNSLQSLKHSLENDDPLEAIWHFFFSLSTESDIFSVSFDASVPRLTEALETTILQSFHVEVAIREFLSLRIEDTSFYHGICWARGLIITYFYFSDLDAGLVAIPNPPFSNNVDLHRFALKEERNLNAKDEKLAQHLH